MSQPKEFTAEEIAWVQKQYAAPLPRFDELIEKIRDKKTRFYNKLSLKPSHFRFDRVEKEIYDHANQDNMSEEIRFILAQFYYIDFQEALIKYNYLNKVDFESAFAVAEDIIIHYTDSIEKKVTLSATATQDDCIRLAWLETDAYYRDKFNI